MPGENFLLVNDDEYRGYERRRGSDCPCGAVKELAAVTQGQFNLINEKLGNQLKTMDTYAASFNEIKVTILECVDGLQKGSQVLRDGDKRFELIEADLENHKVGKLGQHVALEKVISEHKDGELGQHKGIQKGFIKVWVALSLVFGTFLVTGHVSDMIGIILKALRFV